MGTLARRTSGAAVPAVVFLVGALAACSHSRFYGESWQPEERGSTPTPRLLIAALLMKDNADIEAMNHTGATLIGWHDAKNSLALRAASTGGTHFLPVQTPAPVVRSACYPWGDTPLCSAGPKARHWSRVAVFRLTPDRWHALPTHLIPTDGDVTGGVVASAVRTGCRPVNTDYGIVRCNRGWGVVSNAAVAAAVSPMVVEPVGPAVPQPRGPTTTETTEPFIDLEGTAPNP